MIRDAARAVTPAALAELDREPGQGAKRPPECPACHFCHGSGPCLEVRTAAPGECSDVVPTPSSKRAKAHAGYWPGPEVRALRLCVCRRWFLMTPRQKLCHDCALRWPRLRGSNVKRSPKR